MKKVMVVFGVRPEAIKMAPVIKELKRAKDLLETVVVVTAQHREMLDQVLEQFSIVPDYDLDIMRPRQSLYDVTIRTLEGLGPLLARESPDLVLVHGDTSTTFAAALAAYYQQIPVGHVEAGLRTGKKYSPFPEEINRRLADAIADVHFAPTHKARMNLMGEGISPEYIYVTGNTAIDALWMTLEDPKRFDMPIELNLLKGNEKLILVEAHRRENLGSRLESICQGVRKIAESFNDLVIVFSVHRNPSVEEVVYKCLSGVDRIILCEPFNYFEWAHMMARAYLILSDSGGVQEEAPSLGVPVLLLRDVTERPEAIEAGTVKLVGTDARRIFEEASELISNADAYNAMSYAVNPYGDGNAAVRTVLGLLHFFGLRSERPEEFIPSIHPRKLRFALKEFK